MTVSGLRKPCWKAERRRQGGLLSAAKRLKENG